MSRYKVWVQIEEVNDDGEKTGNDIHMSPDCLGTHGSLQAAARLVKRVVYAFGSTECIETSDSCQGLKTDQCEQCGRKLTAEGFCEDRNCLNGVNGARGKWSIQAEKIAQLGIWTKTCQGWVAEASRLCENKLMPDGSPLCISQWKAEPSNDGTIANWRLTTPDGQVLVIIND